MSSTRREWDPLKELVGVHERLNQLFESALARTDFDTKDGVGTWAPATDMHETDEALVVDIELPGLSQEAIEIRIDGDELVVEGERKMERDRSAETFQRVERNYGRFSRRLRLPSTVDHERIEARYRGGVLHIQVGKKPGAGPRAIKVSIS